tara:strand:- start:1145 stop:2098 length:954 start_codon:yes stop_codon:yes gene_type:complete
MLKMVDEKELVKEGVGVIVGRFQVPELHDGHKDLFNTVLDRHDTLICVLGLGAIRASKNNPLDYEARRKMVLDEYPDAIVIYQSDDQCNKSWSKRLDAEVRKHISPGSKVVAYGSRDSFIKHYEGNMETAVFEPESFTSGSAIRKALNNKTKSSKDFRIGALWAVGNQYPVAYPTVDIAIMNEDGDKVLLGRKADEELWRFVGGFVDPSNKFGVKGALEQNARREVMEETGLEVSEMEYLGSFFVNDWRYRSEPDCIMTTLFKTKITYGRPVASDDIANLKYFPISNIIDRKAILDKIVEIHRPLMEALLTTVEWTT